MQTPEAFGALPITADADNVVRLRDVADVQLAAESTDTVVRFNGQPGTFVGVFPTPSANPLDVAGGVLDELPAIRDSLPDGMTVTMVYDATETISASIEEVFKTIAEAVVIVIVVILLFLGSFRSVLMPMVTLPLSLVGVCFFLWAMGYSINLLSLLAMVLAIGLVVDDAIIVVENIHRHIEDGMRPMPAAIKGMQEIWLPIVAMSLTLVAVFVPIGFAGGLTGSLFREFAFTLAGSVLISGVVALTITPMMSARLLKAGNHSRFQKIVDRTSDRVSNWYGRRVDSSLDYRPVMLLVVVVLTGLTGFMFLNTSSELAPEEDSGALFSLVDGAALCDQRVYQPLRRRDRRAHQGHPRSPRAVFHRRNGRRDQFGLRRLGAEGLGRSQPQPGRNPAGHPGPHRGRGRDRGAGLCAAVAARRGWRPADFGRDPVHQRRQPRL